MVVRSQSAEQVHGQPARQPEVQFGWFVDALLSERDTRQGPRSELAASAEGQFHPDAAHVLAQGKQPFDPQRDVDATAKHSRPSTLNVCFWHKADIATVLNDVCFRG